MTSVVIEIRRFKAGFWLNSALCATSAYSTSRRFCVVAVDCLEECAWLTVTENRRDAENAEVAERVDLVPFLLSTANARVFSNEQHKIEKEDPFLAASNAFDANGFI
jgi:hypothetical protein